MTKSASDAIEYANAYRSIDFRKHPEQYKIGRGEQGVLIAEPYKSEILPHWKFATPEVARQSAQTIYGMFVVHRKQNDFVGMDMARKYLQMGFTRSRRYANHPSGKKYDSDNKLITQSEDWESSPKAQSAKIFFQYYSKAKSDDTYQQLMTDHRALEK